MSADCYLYVLADSLQNARKPTLDDETNAGFQPGPSYSGLGASSTSAMTRAYVTVCADLCNRTNKRIPTTTDEAAQAKVDLQRT